MARGEEAVSTVLLSTVRAGVRDVARWYYRDQNGEVQGPFDSKQMDKMVRWIPRRFVDKGWYERRVGAVVRRPGSLCVREPKRRNCSKCYAASTQTWTTKLHRVLKPRQKDNTVGKALGSNRLIIPQYRIFSTIRPLGNLNAVAPRETL